MSTVLYDNPCTGTNGASATTCVQTTGAHPFTVGSGTPTIQANRLVNGSGGTPSVVVTNETFPTADYEVEGFFHCVTNDSAFEVFARYDASNSYNLQYYSGRLYLGKTVAGTDTFFQDVAFTLNAGDDVRLKISVSGNVIRGFANGTEMFTAVTDSAITTAKQAAALLVQVGTTNDATHGTHLDRLVVTDPLGGTSTTIIFFEDTVTRLIKDGETTAARKRIPLRLRGLTGAPTSNSMTGRKAQLSANGGSETASTNDIVIVAGTIRGYVELSDPEAAAFAPGDLVEARVASDTDLLEYVGTAEITSGDAFAAPATVTQIGDEFVAREKGLIGTISRPSNVSVVVDGVSYVSTTDASLQPIASLTPA